MDIIKQIKEFSFQYLYTFLAIKAIFYKMVLQVIQESFKQ